MKGSISRAVILAGAVLLACACGGGETELSPEIAAHIADYEKLIAAFEPQFAAARGDHSEFVKVADAYSSEAQEWMSGWQALAPNLSDDEATAVTAKLDALNKRAERMLTG